MTPIIVCVYMTVERTLGILLRRPQVRVALEHQNVRLPQEI